MAVGSTGSQTVTITNTGNSNVTISSVTVAGAEFSASGVTAGTTLMPNQAVTLNVVFAPTAVGSASGNATVISNATNSPSVVSLTGSGVAQSTGGFICGFVDDGVAHIPANYTTFVPPAEGGSYVDALTGCTVTRVRARYTHMYSLSEAFNSNDTYLLVRSPLGGGWHIVDATGKGVVVPPANMPNQNAIGETLWTASDPNSWYYPLGAAVRKATISGLPGCATTHNCTVTTSLIHDFTGTYSGITFPGDYDLSMDGDHIAFAAQTALNTNVIVSVWSLSGGSQSNTYTIPSCSVADVTQASQPGCLHRLQIDPLNRLVLDIGPRVLESNGTTTQILDSNSSTHSDVGKDINGNAILVQVHNAMPNGTDQNDACFGNGGLSYLLLSDLTDHCLYAADYSADHVSYRGGPSQPYVLWDVGEACSGASVFNNSPSFVAPSTPIPLFQGQCPGEGDVRPLFGSIVITKIDTVGSISVALGVPNSLIIAHHRSRNSGNDGYWPQPRSDLSRDGKYVVFTSNMAYVDGSCTTDDCVDVYVVKVQ